VAVELEHVLAAAETEHALVVAALELVPVAAEPEPGQAMAAPGHPRGRLAAALRTKSVIALHRRGLPRLAAEDLTVVAQTLLGPVAAGAATAWEEAGLVAVVGDAAAVGDEKRSMRKHK
jgi:hypothetical protein